MRVQVRGQLQSRMRKANHHTAKLHEELDHDGFPFRLCFPVMDDPTAKCRLSVWLGFIF
jgi:hypothetical protein